MAQNQPKYQILFHKNNSLRDLYAMTLIIQRYINCREFEDNGSLDGSMENVERGSIASFGSGNTTDSDHLRGEKVRIILTRLKRIESKTARKSWS